MEYLRVWRVWRVRRFAPTRRPLAAAIAGGCLATSLFAGAAHSERPRPPAPAPDAPYVATPYDVVDRLLVLARVGPGDLVYDLGSGDGRIVIAAAAHYGSRGVGYEIDAGRVLQSRELARKRGVETLARFENTNLFSVDLSPASVVTLFLFPHLNARLIPQLEKLAPGSRIVSHDFAIPGVIPAQVVQFRSREDGAVHRLYLWITPLMREP